MDLQLTKKEFKILLLIILLALFVSIIFLNSSAIKDWDETVYANLGYDLSKNPLEYSFSKNGWSDRVPDESWPKAGFRAPLLPYILSLFYFLKLDFMVIYIIPLISALSILIVFYLGKLMFDKKVGIYSAVLFTFIPLNVLMSSKIMTDSLSTFFVLLSILFFWKGYELKIKKYKILFGLFLALSLLSRYSVLWIMPIFPIYLIIRDKSLKFLKDKELVYSLGLFFIILVPWFIYGLSEYNNILGPFLHGLKAATYWGSTEPWYFFFQNSWEMFSIVSIIFLLSLISVFFNKDFKRKEIYFLLLWVFIFLLMAMTMAHKEQRFILQIVPAICLISAFFIRQFKYSEIVIFFIIIILSFSLISQFQYYHSLTYREDTLCFTKAGYFLENKSNSFVISDQSTLGYYYFKKKMTYFPDPWDLEKLKNKIDHQPEKEVYLFYTKFNTPDNENYRLMEKDLNLNFKVVFKCPENESSSIIYQYR